MEHIKNEIKLEHEKIHRNAANIDQMFIKVENTEQDYLIEDQFLEKRRGQIFLKNEITEEFILKNEPCYYENTEISDSDNNVENTKQANKCEICQKIFAELSDLKSHKLVHNEKSYTCDTCQKTFSRINSLKEHKRRTHTEKLYSCNICHKKFKRKDHMNVHMKLTHRAKKLQEIVKIEQVLIKSENREEENNQFESTKKEDTSVKREITEELILTDESYGNNNAVVGNEDHLWVHNSHSKRKQFKCETCQKTFTKSSSLNRHKVVHNNARPFACDICGKAYSRIEYVKYHKERCIHRSHTKKPLVCDICQKIFKESSRLIRHKMMHSGEKPYACDICPKKFAESGKLKRHRSIHSGEKPFECDICQKTFRCFDYLKVHKVCTHNVEHV